MDRFTEREENEHESSLDHNANIIASQPSSAITNLYECSLEEQNKDLDIVWIKDLILKYKDNKPKLNQFSNPERKVELCIETYRLSFQKIR